MKFFNSQNFQRNNGKTVYLNITDYQGSFDFQEVIRGQYSDIGSPCTVRQFRRAKVRKLCYNYRNDLHECNYSETRTSSGQVVTFTYTLNKINPSISDPDLPNYWVYDLGKAIFLKGSPVLKFSVPIQVNPRQSDDVVGAVTYTTMKNDPALSPDSPVYAIEDVLDGYTQYFLPSTDDHGQNSVNISDFVECAKGNRPRFGEFIRIVYDEQYRIPEEVAAWFPVYFDGGVYILAYRQGDAFSFLGQLSSSVECWDWNGRNIAEDIAVYFDRGNYSDSLHYNTNH